MQHPLPAGATLRPIRDDDRAFMAALYGAGRQAELAAFPFDEQQKALFLQSQFEAQYRQYFGQYDSSRYCLVELGGEPIGRWLPTETPQHFRLVDIALLPRHQGLGIGSALLRALQAEARQKQKTIQLQVESHSRARALYDRLGFEPQGEGNGLYLPMAWAP
ncbi:GNAT family N-acetyltransferase [Gallaecimonas kandeliae]|uniref:GNAT family N-acetyltransferase n=1 Tax=Gallaecimonas kandeliae TaxID=3029055 RepID=UPI002647E987|nr:GNAT family N-acetyltransferase [Gallaecimonas kandeliae]WKE65930.1 GNAT family N-acetyltransferase [Gallaecimonas kandeliae]